MFGNFWQQFGLNFPFAGADAQGGMFAAFQSPDPAGQQLHMAGQSPTPPGPQAAATPAPKPEGAMSPLAASPLAPQTPQMAQAQPQQSERRGSFALDRMV